MIIVEVNKLKRKENQPKRQFKVNGKWVNNPVYTKKYHKKQFEDNPELCRKKWRYYGRERNRKLRMEILELLGSKCCKCEFSDWRALQVDHVNGGGCKEVKKYANPARYYKNIIQKIKAGSKGYQLLCANCNWIKRYKNRETR